MTIDLRAHLQSALGDGYTVDRELAGGGMSRVYVVKDAALRREIVVKVLPPELAADVTVVRFEREIALAARLQHPHIVPLLSAGVAHGLPYYTMPFIAGESLRQRLDRDGVVAVGEAVRLLREIAAALAYAHARGIVHRDIKPGNVLLSGGVALVADFGVAKALMESSTVADGPLTSAGIAVGTPAYMAPEQVSADPGVDHRADLYSFGMIAYEMLAGRSPFGARSRQELLVAHLIEAPGQFEARQPSVPPMLAALVMRCLAKRPADRPHDASEIVQALDELVTPAQVSAAPPALLPRNNDIVPRGAQWRASRTIAGALALILIAAAGAALYVRSRARNAEAPLLVVAPFENLTDDSTLDYGGLVVADRLATEVALVGSTNVVPSTVAFDALRDAKGAPVEQIRRLADATHASLVVVGTFARRRDSLELNAQVVDGRTGNLVHQLDQIAGPATDFVGAATALGGYLVGWLGMQGISYLPRKGFRAPNADALRAFHQGYEALFLRGSYLEARVHLERAIALDSGFVRAYLMLFATYRYADPAHAESLLARVERLPRRRSAEQALLDFDRADLKDDLRGMLAAQQRLAAIDSSVEALQRVGERANDLQRPDLAVPALEKARVTDAALGGARAAGIARDLATAYHQTGEHDRELRLVRDTRAKSLNRDLEAGRQLGAYAALGRGMEALALADTMVRAPGANPNGDVLVFVGWGVHEFRAHGDTATASKLLEKARAWMITNHEPTPTSFRQFRDAMTLFDSRMYDSAAVEFAAAARDVSQREAPGYLVLAQLAGGNTARARAVADSLSRLNQPSSRDNFWHAAIVGALGDRKLAVQLLEKASNDGAARGTWHNNAALESLYGYPPFEELIRSMR